MRPLYLATCLLTAAFACAPARSDVSAPGPAPRSGPGIPPPPAEAPKTPPPPAPAPAEARHDSVGRIAPPAAAYARGWMPVSSTGVERFLRAHPEFDGRGVLIGILDTGIDPGIPGLMTTTTGSPKVLDLRDFSGEGAVPLAVVRATGDSVEVAGRRLGGFGSVVSLNTSGPYYAGTIAEIPLGGPPAADLNGNGAVRDTLPVIVVRATDGWVLLADTDGDGSLAGERPVHDYLAGRELFGWSFRGAPSKVTVAANFTDEDGTPRLDLYFDTGSHGSHVSGIAAGHDIYGVRGFNGVAPGAQLLGLKIANSAQGGISTSGSMLRALDYAIRFAEARRLPLVLNLSFGVGNEIEGRARIDHIVDSVLTQHPTVVMTISAGNDGPGLSTTGFPGSASRAISVGATLPAAFLPPRAAGSPPSDMLAYFSARGGEVARPDLVTPGVAYSTVPRWNAGDEVAQGTSMAAPHAAGLAALLVSALAQEQRSYSARDIRQALMVTAQPMPGGTVLDEGTGLADVDRAYTWLGAARPVADIQVRAMGAGNATGAVIRGRRGAVDAVQAFELIRPPGAAPSAFTLRSDASWLTAPPRLALRGPRTSVELRVARRGLPTSGAAVGTVTAWTADTLAGPAFRLVTTVVSSAPVASGTQQLRDRVALPAGATLRTFFQADSGRPFALTIETGAPAERALGFLHEPRGMPFRDESARSAGHGQQSAEYQTDSRDAVAGIYEAVVVAPPDEAVSASVRVSQSPVTLSATRRGEAVQATVTNVTVAPVETEIGMHLGGASRVEAVAGVGSGAQRIPFVVPRWSRGVVVDIAMDPEQWARFTDFGVTLFDSLGHQLGKQPLNYAFGRLQVQLPPGHGDVPVTLGLFPGFADSAGDQRWSLRTSVRVYADTSVLLARSDSGTSTIAPNATATASFALPGSPWPLGPKFVPLGLLVARAEGRTWTRELELPPPGAALVP